MSDEKTAGASYLAALKQMGGAATGAAPARDHASPSGAEALADAGPGEKRRSPRYRCQGSAHLREVVSGTAFWASFSDVSMHGCYIEAPSTFPVGSELAATIEINGFRVECRGRVQVMYPGLGMGIAFTEISEENREKLRDLLKSLAQPSVILDTRPDPRLRVEAPAAEQAPVKDPAAALQAISKFFEERHMLGREEFLRILRKSQY